MKKQMLSLFLALARPGGERSGPRRQRGAGLRLPGGERL